MNDKVKHILAGALFAFMVGVPAYVSSGDIFAGLWASLAGVVAGGVKEWCDMQHGGKWDWKDFAFTCIGVAVIALFIVGLHYGKG